MATNFPIGIDNFPTHTDNNNEKIQAAHLNNVQDGLKATQQKVLDMQTSVDDAVDSVNTTLNNTLGEIDTTLDNALNEIYANDISQYNVIKTNKDANGIYTTVDYKRTDNTLFMKSVLSNASGGNYLTKTETYYALNGTTVIKTDTWTLTYDSDGNVTSEVKS